MSFKFTIVMTLPFMHNSVKSATPVRYTESKDFIYFTSPPCVLHTLRFSHS